MKTISATRLAKTLPDVLNRVRKGEVFLVERWGEPVARIVPAEWTKTLTLNEFVDLMRHSPRPDSSFADDLERIHSWQPPALGEFTR